MKSLLSRVKKSDIETDPFPHIVITDPIEDDLCLRLISEFPTVDTITEGKVFGSNQRFSYPAHKALSNDHVSPLWKEFIKTNTSKSFLNQFTSLFDEHIRSLYPSFEKKIGALEGLQPGIMGIDTFSTADVLLIPDICINTPVFGVPSTVRRPHVDLPNKLFVGLYYLRGPDDTSTGGNLEIYKFKNNRNQPYGFEEQFIDDQYVELVKTVKYERNVLVLFPNSIQALHGVTIRATTNSQRNFFFIAGEVNQSLFNLSSYQKSKLKVLKKKLKHVIRPLLVKLRAYKTKYEN